jgi:scyllo-inositol 2-dehydrogenase (NADP+)
MLSSLARARFHLRGARGNFCKWGLDPQEDALNKITRIDDSAWGQEPQESWGTLRLGIDGDPVTTPVPSQIGDYRRFYAGVRDALLGKPSNELATATDAWHGVRILEWAKQSSEEHREIECDWTSEPA